MTPRLSPESERVLARRIVDSGQKLISRVRDANGTRRDLDHALSDQVHISTPSFEAHASFGDEGLHLSSQERVSLTGYEERRFQWAIQQDGTKTTYCQQIFISWNGEEEQLATEITVVEDIDPDQYGFTVDYKF